MCYFHWSMREQWYCHRLTDTLCCKLTYTFILSMLSLKQQNMVLWLPQMSLPDLRDDVIGFFKCLKEGEKRERLVK